MEGEYLATPPSLAKHHHPSFFGNDLLSFFAPQPRSITGPVIAISPLHGNLSSLEILWKQISAAEGFESATLVFLGNYIDCGPMTRQVLDWLIDLRHKRPTTIFLSGPHEFAAASFLGLLKPPAGFDAQKTQERQPGEGKAAEGEGVEDRLWEGPGANSMHVQGRRWAAPSNPFNSSSTFASYGVAYGDREALLRAMPAEHKEFLKDLPWVVEHTDYIFLHGSLSTSEPLDTQLESLHKKDLAIWQTARPTALFSHSHADCSKITPKMIVHGGPSVEQVTVTPTDVCLHVKEKVAALMLPSELVVTS
jgi:hypothetical protein